MLWPHSLGLKINVVQRNKKFLGRKKKKKKMKEGGEEEEEWSPSPSLGYNPD